MDKCEELKHFLKEQHNGIENAVFSRELESRFSLSGRSLRRRIHQLRKEGVPICSSEKGYYYSEAEKDVRKTTERMGEFVESIAKACKGMLYATVELEQFPRLQLIIKVQGGAP